MGKEPLGHAKADLEDLHVDRLRHVIVGADVEDLVDHLHAFVGRDDDDVGNDVGGAVALAELAAEIEAAHAAHIDVHDDDLREIDLAGLDLLEGLLAAGGLADLVPPPPGRN